MRGESLACPEGVVDVSVIIPSCFENPLKAHSIDLLVDVLTQRRRAILPVSAILGAYHITTRYIRVPRVTVKKILEGILRSGSPALYPHITPQVALDALDYASTYNVESWDGYLIALIRSLGSNLVFSIDKELAKVREITVVSPFPDNEVERYHRFLESKIDQDISHRDYHVEK